MAPPGAPPSAHGHPLEPLLPPRARMHCPAGIITGNIDKLGYLPGGPLRPPRGGRGGPRTEQAGQVAGQKPVTDRPVTGFLRSCTLWTQKPVRKPVTPFRPYIILYRRRDGA